MPRLTSVPAIALALVALPFVAVRAAQHGGDDRPHLAQTTATTQLGHAGRRPGMMGMGHGASDMGAMSTHELVVNHDRITRTVTNLPDGIRTVTESADPQLAQRIKEHVTTMDQQVTTGSDLNLPIETPALHAIFQNHDKVHTTIETATHGVIVIQTSTDPEIVAALQQHASEVSDLVQGGMTAMHAAMMKNGGAMMAAMHGASLTASAQQPMMPAGMTHEQHLAQMKKEADLKQHGNMAMGFDQDKATHHFTLTADGGVIAVEANDPADQMTRDQIRAHLGEIAQAFGIGDFQKPVMTHGELPTGASAMQRRKDRITYAFERTEHGGAVRIRTSDQEALDAIHEFLRYQIREHATGKR